MGRTNCRSHWIGRDGHALYGRAWRCAPDCRSRTHAAESAESRRRQAAAEAPPSMAAMPAALAAEARRQDADLCDGRGPHSGAAVYRWDDRRLGLTLCDGCLDRYLRLDAHRGRPLRSGRVVPIAGGAPTAAELEAHAAASDASAAALGDGCADCDDAPELDPDECCCGEGCEDPDACYDEHHQPEGSGWEPEFPCTFHDEEPEAAPVPIAGGAPTEAEQREWAAQAERERAEADARAHADWERREWQRGASMRELRGPVPIAGGAPTPAEARLHRIEAAARAYAEAAGDEAAEAAADAPPGSVGAAYGELLDAIAGGAPPPLEAALDAAEAAARDAGLSDDGLEDVLAALDEARLQAGLGPAPIAGGAPTPEEELALEALRDRVCDAARRTAEAVRDALGVGQELPPAVVAAAREWAEARDRWLSRMAREAARRSQPDQPRIGCAPPIAGGAPTAEEAAAYRAASDEAGREAKRAVQALLGRCARRGCGRASGSAAYCAEHAPPRELPRLLLGAPEPRRAGLVAGPRIGGGAPTAAEARRHALDAERSRVEALVRPPEPRGERAERIARDAEAADAAARDEVRANHCGCARCDADAREVLGEAEAAALRERAP